MLIMKVQMRLACFYCCDFGMVDVSKAFNDLFMPSGDVIKCIFDRSQVHGCCSVDQGCSHKD